jgi:hypothetical protein
MFYTYIVYTHPQLPNTTEILTMSLNNISRMDGTETKTIWRTKKLNQDTIRCGKVNLDAT